MGILEEAHNLRVIGRDTAPETIVLAHGFGTDQSVWRHLVPHLVDEYRLVLFDNIGAGTTNPDYFDFERYATLEGYALDLLAIMEELRLGPCIFVGHSVSAIIGAMASISRPDFFSKIVMLSASPRYLNDVDYFGGFEQDELNQLFDAMRSNYKAWVSGFAPLAVGGDMASMAVQEFSRTLFNIRPDIALNVGQTIFQSDLRDILGLVTVPCHIIQSTKDLAVPVVLSEYLHRNLGGESIVEVMPSEGHLPQLSSPEIVIPVLLRHIRYNIAVKDENNCPGLDRWENCKGPEKFLNELKVKGGTPDLSPNKSVIYAYGQLEYLQLYGDEYCKQGRKDKASAFMSILQLQIDESHRRAAKAI